MRERGLKYGAIYATGKGTGVAPYAGAWIEISLCHNHLKLCLVAPYAGAWIEMASELNNILSDAVAPYAGAWIEISTCQ